MSERIRKGYRDRLQVGDMVYLLEGAGSCGIVGRDASPLVVKEAMITQTTENPYVDIQRKKPIITIFHPNGKSLVSERSAREVFTPDEVAYHLRTSEYTRDLIKGKKLEEILRSDPGNKDVIGTLGAAVMNRMIDDFVANPRYPEDPGRPPWIPF